MANSSVATVPDGAPLVATVKIISAHMLYPFVMVGSLAALDTMRQRTLLRRVQESGARDDPHATMEDLTLRASPMVSARGQSGDTEGCGNSTVESDLR